MYDSGEISPNYSHKDPGHLSLEIVNLDEKGIKTG